MEHLASLLLIMMLMNSDLTISTKCLSAGSTSLELTVSSRKNSSGHWMISVDAIGENSKSIQQIDKNQKGIDIRMEHGAVYCQGTETQHLLVNAAVPGSGPPDGYKPMAGLGYYKMYLTPLIWEQARDKCEEEGAHLLILESEKETLVIKEFFARKPQIKGATHTVHIHLGVHDRYKEGQYEDVLGNVVPVAGNSLWLSGQPDGGAENCVVGTTLGRYADAPCDWKLAFICEFV